MKVFISYQSVSKKAAKIKIILNSLVALLQAKNYEAFCPFLLYDELKTQGLSEEEIHNYSLKKLMEHDLILFFINSDYVYEKMSQELDHALAQQKRVYLAIRKDLTFDRFRSKAEHVIEFSSLTDLYKEVAKTDFHDFLENWIRPAYHCRQAYYQTLIDQYWSNAR